MKKVAIIVFPGSNCDHDAFYVINSIGNVKVDFVWHKDSDLSLYDVIVIPGGLSYGDYLRAGAIARFSPIMKQVINHANNGGVVIGVCNGFQILCESGLLPGALLHNNNQKFICKNVWLKPESKTASITQHLNHDKAYNIPIAHGEGRYFADEKTLQLLNDNDQVLFRYCDSDATVSSESNPNGSEENISGICNSAKNVFGMMPHPERAADENLGNLDGKNIFESLLNLVSA